MSADDSNVQSVEIVAAALGDLCDELVLVGGCAVSLLIDAPAAPPPRVTYDVDLMPTDETILGFSNRWYQEAASTAMRLNLPSGTPINLISAPAFLATKFEAFHSRGKADLMESHDFEDIINVVEGRQHITEEVTACGMALRAYLAQQFAGLMERVDFMNVLPGLVTFDALHAQRIERVRQRIVAIAAMGTT